MNKKGFTNIVLVLVVVVIVGVVGYLIFTKQSNQSGQIPTQTNQTNQQPQNQIGNQTPQPSQAAKEKVFRSPLANTPAPTVGKPLTLYDPLLEAYFEGYDRLYYEFSYPESDFSITTSLDNRKITIKEIATGKTDTVNISYEGGRGYTPQDYWNYTLKPSCASCEPVANPISVKDAQGLATFANKDKEWIVFSGPSTGGGGAWLFAAELQKPATEVEKIISTFTFVSAK